MQHHEPRLSDHFFTRREFLSRCGIGMGGLALSSILPDAGQASASSALSVKGAHFTPRAKRVIHIFLNGGPSHVDTFDPKPMLTKQQGKPIGAGAVSRLSQSSAGRVWLGSPWEFKQRGQSGLWVSELFPHAANVIDELCVVRSLVGDTPLHGAQNLLMHTGRSIGAAPSTVAASLPTNPLPTGSATPTISKGPVRESAPAHASLC